MVRVILFLIFIFSFCFSYELKNFNEVYGSMRSPFGDKYDPSSYNSYDADRVLTELLKKVYPNFYQTATSHPDLYSYNYTDELPSFSLYSKFYYRIIKLLDEDKDKIEGICNKDESELIAYYTDNRISVGCLNPIYEFTIDYFKYSDFIIKIDDLIKTKYVFASRGGDFGSPQDLHLRVAKFLPEYSFNIHNYIGLAFQYYIVKPVDYYNPCEFASVRAVLDESMFLRIMCRCIDDKQMDFKQIKPKIHIPLYVKPDYYASAVCSADGKVCQTNEIEVADDSCKIKIGRKFFQYCKEYQADEDGYRNVDVINRCFFECYYNDDIIPIPEIEPQSFETCKPDAEDKLRNDYLKYSDPKLKPPLKPDDNKTEPKKPDDNATKPLKPDSNSTNPKKPDNNSTNPKKPDTNSTNPDQGGSGDGAGGAGSSDSGEEGKGTGGSGGEGSGGSSGQGGSDISEGNKKGDCKSGNLLDCILKNQDLLINSHEYEGIKNFGKDEMDALGKSTDEMIKNSTGFIDNIKKTTNDIKNSYDDVIKALKKPVKKIDGSYECSCPYIKYIQVFNQSIKIELDFCKFICAVNNLTYLMFFLMFSYLFFRLIFTLILRII